MTKRTGPTPAHPAPDLRPMSDSAFEDVEVMLLHLSRYLLQTFQNPRSHSWLHAIDLSCSDVFAGHGKDILIRLIATLQELRMARHSAFRFSHPQCKTCAGKTTAHERQFMACLAQVRRGRSEHAEGMALILCEANPTQKFIKEISALAVLVSQAAIASYPVDPPAA